ncbi:MAG TPA: alpha/beta fold hydrolase [Bryobacteraceae bacterium]|nr:alpha/beta fold hydrolase [Bryobacteraceae bacterium]
MRAFEPFFKNPHLATIAAAFWSRPQSELRWPVRAVRYQTEPGIEILVHSQAPDSAPRGELVMVHGLEGSSDSGYARSMAYAALEAGFATHRVNLRSCGGTEALALSNYHSGQTSDVLHVLGERKRASGLPIYLAGFSLGGNVSLKLAGELGEAGRELLDAVCAVSTPIDLAACADELGKPQNYLYANRFLAGLKEKIRIRERQAPEIYSTENLKRVRTIYDFDDYYTARLFGFGTAANYYRTQSSNQYLEKIRVPTLVVIAKDDPLVPFAVYDHPAFRENPCLRLLAVQYGGHVGFISRRPPRFWLDSVVVDWLDEIENKTRPAHVSLK